MCCLVKMTFPTLTFIIFTGMQLTCTCTLSPKIIKPSANETIEVDVGHPAEIECKAVTPNSDVIFLNWFSGNKTQEYRTERKQKDEEDKTYLIAKLKITKVTNDELNKIFICKLESPYPEQINVSIKLKQREPPQNQKHLYIVVPVVVFVACVTIVSVIYYKLKIDIVLLWREFKCSALPATDGKGYDAFVTYYPSSSDEALSESEHQLVLNVLEERYGYTLCLYDRDVLPGTVAAEQVLELVMSSRRLVLLPSAAGVKHQGHYTLLGGVHAALVERHTQLIVVQRNMCESLCLLPESLQLLLNSATTIIWHGRSSSSHSSAFCKHLRYYMPARKLTRNHKVTTL